MEQIEEAHHELDRIQDIITRHEGFMFALRGWLITIIGGLLVAYYTDNVEMSEPALAGALVAVSILFWIVESRHTNLIEAVVERAGVIENQIAGSRQPARDPNWYDGPKVCEACERGVAQIRPFTKMTFKLNLPFYLVVSVIILAVIVSLPPKTQPASAETPTVAPAAN